MKILIKGGRVIDPANNLDAIADLLIDGRKISRVAKNIMASADKIIEAKGKIIIPGIVDMHVHLREPGREDKETIASGTGAGLKGGVTSLLAMPNTQPAIDTPQAVKMLKEIIRKDAQLAVYICGAITKGRQGQELADIAGLKQAGVVAISDDGASVEREDLLLRALRQAKKERLLVICHCEDKFLSDHGVVNLGYVSTKLGLRGISRESEYKRVERDIALAKKSAAAIHIAHVSCRESVELVAKAKKAGVRVTCETAPHYFALDDSALWGYDTNLKMNPPLRCAEDVAAIKEGLRDGTIDVVASDHAPHTENEKAIEFDRAEFGVIGLETELAAGISVLIGNGVLQWTGLVQKMCVNPARILGLSKGTLSPSADADIAIIAPDKEWTVKREEVVSKSKNSAFLGRQLKGVVEYTVCAGKIAYQASSPSA